LQWNIAVEEHDSNEEFCGGYSLLQEIISSGKALNDVAVLGKIFQQRCSVSKRKVSEFKPWSDDAAHQRIAFAFRIFETCAKPAFRRDGFLQDFTVFCRKSKRKA
jgi:hypothetical protein